MSIERLEITKLGHELLAKTPGGCTAKVTKWQFGAGPLPAGKAAADAETLVKPLKDIPISSVVNTENQSIVKGQFTNAGMDAFVWEELGLFAEDPDRGEILYAYGNARGTGDEVQSHETKYREFEFGVQLIFTGDANVTVDLEKSLIFATLEDLEATEAKIGGYYQTFEREDWADGELRIPQAKHRITPARAAAMCRITQHVDRTALDYYGASVGLGRQAVTNAVAAALAANRTAPGTYPTGPDGHPQLTWNQVQYYILNGALVTDAAAAAAANAHGFDWRDRDTTGAVTTLTLDDILAAAHIPALGGSDAGLTTLCTATVLQALRLRRKADGAGDVDTYDLDGEFISSGWGAFGTSCVWDIKTNELVLRAEGPYAGAVLVTA